MVKTEILANHKFGKNGNLANHEIAKNEDLANHKVGKNGDLVKTEICRIKIWQIFKVFF